MDLARLFHPASIAVVGASERPGSYSAQTLTNLERIGFPGSVWGVNPNRDRVFGHPCVPTISDLPVAVDAVLVAIPAAGVSAVIEQAGQVGCGGAVVLSAGFGEVPGGEADQRALVAAARRHRLPVCGPNGNGIVAMHARTALWGDALTPREPGPVALVSQSGNVAVNALSTRRGLRLHTVVSSGNQAVLSAADYLEFLAREDGVRAIALYLEEDGDERLCDGLATCAERHVPVAVLKVGSSRAGARAAAAHSGALAGDQRVFRSLVAEAGGVWAEDVHELLELAKTLAVPRRGAGVSGGAGVLGGAVAGVSNGAGAPVSSGTTGGLGPPDGGAPAGAPVAPATATPTPPGLAILTCSGGDSAQGADEAARLGIALPALAAATAERLRAQLPAAATVANPLDYTAMIWGEREALGELVRTVGEDPAIDQVLVFYDQPPGLDGAIDASWSAVRDGIILGSEQSPTPTMVCSTLPELLDDASAWRFAQAGVPAAAGLRTGLRCAAALLAPAPDPARPREIAAAAAAQARRRGVGSRTGGNRDGWLGEHESKRLLRAGGVSVVEGRLVHGEDDAVQALAQLGGAVALKLTGATIQHKTELGGIALGLRTEVAVRDAYRRLAPLAAQHQGAVLAERMVAPGVELLIAARTQAIVPALVVGLGGIWTELLDDVVVVPLPAGADRMERALRSLRAAALLVGERGREPVDLGAAAALAARAGELLLEHGLELIELNPVIVSEFGAVAVDALARAG